jgi:RNA polymerase sigma factor (sigma-70 family)
MACYGEKMIMRYAATYESSIGLDEADLVIVAQKGDLEAFNQLVLFYQDRVFSLAARILGDEDSAEDITQNTFLTAYLKLPRFRNGSFRSWLYRIATNACLDELRRHKRRPVLSLENEEDAEERFLPLYDFPRSSILPEKEAERHELERAVQQALNQLDTDQRAVVVLVDLQDFDYQEVAQILGVPIGTVKSRLARARLRLRHLLITCEASSI